MGRDDLSQMAGGTNTGCEDDEWEKGVPRTGQAGEQGVVGMAVRIQGARRDLDGGSGAGPEAPPMLRNWTVIEGYLRTRFR